MSVNIDGLNQFSRDLKSVDMNKMHEGALDEVCQRIYAGAVKRTPVGESFEEHIGGQLRMNWSISKTEKQSDKLMRKIYNNTEYASYVEYGHRQNVGQFVPRLGKKLKSPWVNGKFMLTRTEDEIKPNVGSILTNHYEKAMREVMQ